MPKFKKSSVSKAPPTLKKEYGSPFTMKGWGGFQNSPMEDHEKDAEGNVIEHEEETETETETKRVDMTMENIRKKYWADYQKTLPDDHPDKGKPAP